MGAVEAFVEVVKALTWPAVAVIVLVTWRRELLKLVTRLEELTGPGGLSMKFRSDVAAAAESAREVRAENVDQADGQGGVGNGNPSIVDELGDASIAAPLSAMLASWIEVERMSADAAGALGKGVPLRSVRSVVGELSRRGSLDSRYVSLAEELQRLRNAAVHQQPGAVDPQTATQFIEASAALRDAINVAIFRLTSA